MGFFLSDFLKKYCAGKRRTWICAGLWVLIIAATVFTTFFGAAITDRFQPNEDVIAPLDAARSVIEGKGYRTYIHFPFETRFGEKRGNTWPYIDLRRLAQPLFLLPIAALNSNSSTLLFIYSVVFFLFALIPLFLITKIFFDTQAGLLAVFLAASDAAVAKVCCFPASHLPFLILTLWSLYLLLSAKGSNTFRMILAAALLGCAGYFRDETIIWLLPFLIYAWKTSPSGKFARQGALMIIIYALILVPKFIFQFHTFGSVLSPYTILSLSNHLRSFGNWHALNTIDIPSLGDIFGSHGDEFLYRSYSYFLLQVKEVFSSHTLIFFFALYGSFENSGKPDKMKFFYLVFGLFMWGLLYWSFFIPSDKHTLYPILILAPAAACGLISLVKNYWRRDWVHRLGLAIFLGGIAIWLIAHAILPIADKKMREDVQKMRTVRETVYADIMQKIPPDGIVITDQYAHIGFHTRRSTLTLPPKAEDINRYADELEIGERLYPVLGDMLIMQPFRFDEKYHQAILRQTSFDKYQLLSVYNNELFAVILFAPNE